MITGQGSFTWTDAGKASILTQGAVSPAAVGALHNATVDVFVAAIAPNGGTQFGDLTLPSWTAYAAQPVTWQSAAPVVRSLAQMDGDGVVFALPVGAVGQTIYGWAVSNTTPILVGVYLLTTPIVVNFAGDLIVAPFLPWQS